MTVYRFHTSVVSDQWVTVETEEMARDKAMDNMQKQGLFVCGPMTLVATACAHADSLLNQIGPSGMELVPYRSSI